MTALDPALRLRELGLQKRNEDEARREFMAEFCAAVERAYRVGMTPTQIIRASGLTRTTVYRMLEGVQR